MDPPHRGAVDLADVREVHAELLLQGGAVALDVFWLVVGQPPKVERLVRP
jgi:hypothetical protein